MEDMYLGGGGGWGGGGMSMAFMIPIEAKLRSLGVKLLYEVCRVQKFSVVELRESTFWYISFDFLTHDGWWCRCV